MATATQSVTLNQILDAVEDVLLFGTNLADGLGLDEAYVQEAYSGYRPRSGEPQEVCYGITVSSPVMYHGAGRLGHDTFLTLEVKVFTRLETDVAGSDKQWSRDATLGALVMCAKVEDLFVDSILYGSYDPVTREPLGLPLVVEHIQPLPDPGPSKPAPGQSDQSTDVGGYGVTTMYFQLKIVLNLNN